MEYPLSDRIYPDDLVRLVVETALDILEDERLKKVTILRGCAMRSRDYANDVRHELQSRGVEVVMLPLALASWAPPDAATDGDSRGLIIDATQTYPLLAAQYAALARTPLLTVSDGTQSGYQNAQPALFLSHEITTGQTPPGHRAAHAMLVEDIATQQVVVEVTGTSAVDIHTRDMSELINPERATVEHTTITMHHDSMLTLRCDRELIKATFARGGTSYIWWTDEILIDAVDDSQAVRFDNSEHLGITGRLTIGRLDHHPLRTSRSPA